MSSSPYGAARVARQAKWFAVAKVGIAMVALLWQFVLVRHLSVPDYANFTIFIAANGVLVFVTMFGVDRVVYRLIPPLRETLRWREMWILMLGLLAVRLACVALILGMLALCDSVVLPRPIFEAVRALPWLYVAFSFATACTDSLTVYSNSLGLQGRQALFLMGSTALRCLLILIAAWHGAMDVGTVAGIVVATEILLDIALAVSLLRELAAVRPVPAPAGPLQFGFTLKTLVNDSLSTQLTYMLGLPFRGTLLKLIVGAMATPLVTASFGFFQAMADRAYQFTPIFLMKGMLEPALASDYSRRGDFERIRMTVTLLLRINYTIFGLGLALLLGCGEPLIQLVTNGRYGSEVPLAILVLVQLAALTLGEALWITLNPIGRIGYHNKLWFWFSLLCYGAVAAATLLHSVTGLLLVSTAPYLMVFGWLRWVSREPCLQGGLGLHRLSRLALPMAAAVAAARLGLLLPAGLLATMVALLAALLAFTLVLRRSGLFDSAEIGTVSAISPRLANILRLVSP